MAKSQLISEKFYLNYRSYIEVGWNTSAIQDDMIRIVIDEKSAVCPRESLETYMLYLAKDPIRFGKSTTQQVKREYLPVPKDEYKKFLEWKKYKGRSAIHKTFY